MGGPWHLFLHKLIREHMILFVQQIYDYPNQPYDREFYSPDLLAVTGQLSNISDRHLLESFCPCKIPGSPLSHVPTGMVYLTETHGTLRKRIRNQQNLGKSSGCERQHKNLNLSLSLSLDRFFSFSVKLLWMERHISLDKPAPLLSPESLFPLLAELCLPNPVHVSHKTHFEWINFIH